LAEGKISLVKKRDGRLVRFEQDRITNAILKALKLLSMETVN